MQDVEKNGRRQRIEEIKAFLGKHVNGLLIYDEQLVRRLVEKIMEHGDRLWWDLNQDW